MRAELQARVARNADSVFHNGWRPACGWLLVYGVGAILIGLTIAFFHYMVTGDKYLLTTLNENLMNFILLLSIPGAVNGVTSWGKSYERGKAMEATAPEPTTTIVTPAPANSNVAPASSGGVDIGDIVGKTIKAVAGRRR